MLCAEKKPVPSVKDDTLVQEYFEQALAFYDQADWDKAKSSFYKYLQLIELNDVQKSEGLFYYAKSSFNEGDYSVAIQAYNEFLECCLDNEKRQIAQWDRVMIAFDVNKELAVKYLTSLAFDNGYKYMQEAKELLVMLL